MIPIKILQLPNFKRSYKKLHQNQKLSVDRAIEAITKNPYIGEVKKGDLVGVFVYKFNCVNQQFLLAYKFDTVSRTLFAVGMHENFYRSLKKSNFL